MQGYPSKRRSLVDDAKFETKKNREVGEEIKRQLSAAPPLAEDGILEQVFTFEALPEIEGDLDSQTTTVVLSLKKGVESLTEILKIIEKNNVKVSRLETRKARCKNVQHEAFVELTATRDDLLNLMKVLMLDGLADLRIIKEISTAMLGDIWFPVHITDLDFCTHVLTKFEPDLDSTHPGFSDPVYRERRKKIAEIAFDYKQGKPIPYVEYTAEERKTWSIVYNEVRALAPTHACKEFNQMLQLLERELDYGPDNIPQLETVSNFLKRRSGFSLRPASGLLTARDFLASLAFRVFQCTQYVRHSSAPQHSPEPDCIHELIGHIPMFSDPKFAQFSQEIGLASLGVSDEDIEKLATLYWFTVEFGLCKEPDGSIKAYGAGLLSSVGEMKHALSSTPQVLAFDPQKAALQPYQDLDYQDTYFVAENFEDVQEKFRRWVRQNCPRPFSVTYEPYTQTVHVLDHPKKLVPVMEQIKSDLAFLSAGIQSICAM